MNQQEAKALKVGARVEWFTDGMDYAKGKVVGKDKDSVRIEWESGARGSYPFTFCKGLRHTR